MKLRSGFFLHTFMLSHAVHLWFSFSSFQFPILILSSERWPELSSAIFLSFWSLFITLPHADWFIYVYIHFGQDKDHVTLPILFYPFLQTAKWHCCPSTLWSRWKETFLSWMWQRVSSFSASSCHTFSDCNIIIIIPFLTYHSLLSTIQFHTNWKTEDTQSVILINENTRGGPLTYSPLSTIPNSRKQSNV